MEALYHQTNVLIQATRQNFQHLELYKGRIGEEVDNIEREIDRQLSELNGSCSRLAIMASKEPASRRHSAKIRVDQLKYDVQHLVAALGSYRREVAARRHRDREREELLAMKFTSNDTSILIDHSVTHNQALGNANQGVDELLSSGTSILENMRSQRMTLKNAHRRIMDVANTLGLSNTTMRLIEKRAKEDKYILIGGMVVTSIIIIIGIIYLT